MLISYNWLKQYVDLPDSLTPEELALKLTMSTVEVEKVERRGENLENIVVGKILKIGKHPNADKLKICVVDDGQNKIQVVCGGSNLREGMLVAFAKVGAKVRWHGEGESVELKETEIRGVKSYGMICASTEIGLGEMFPLKDEKEILDLSSHSGRGRQAVVGSPLSVVLGLDDVVFEIDNKSMTHRPDLWGHYGLAREVAALFKKKLGNYEIRKLKKKVGTGLNLSVRIENKKLCPRYMAVAIDGVKIGPSPEWMQKLLLAEGLRPINNIVDITNYILLDLGQPMHAFDASRLNPKSEIRNPKIVVRRAKEGEKFKTLDGQEYKLTEEMLMIADEKKAIALAGVMGGENSEISDKTTTIIYESATFDAANIRKTALKLGLRTESSARFEKSLDPNNAELALRRAVELTLEFCPDAKVASKIIDEKNFHLNQGPIELPLEFLNKKIGQEIPKKEVISILERLGFGVKDKKGKLSVVVPSWRATKDISIPEDLAEEVARIYGYENIEPKLPSCPITPPERNELRGLERKIKNILSLEFGFTEVYNYSFVSPEIFKKLGFSKKDIEEHIELENPIDKSRPYLRRHLWPNLLENVEKNQPNFDVIKLFEIGKAFRKDVAGLRAKNNDDELLPNQDLILDLVYSAKETAAPFFELSSALADLLEYLNCNFEFKAGNRADFITHSSRQAEVWVEGARIGRIGEVSPLAQEKLGLRYRTAFAGLDLDQLVNLLKEEKKYQPLPVYPAVERDIAFVVDKTVQHAEIVKVIKKIDPLIEKVELFDVYEGENLPAGKKSLAYHIIYRSPERTLTSEEVDKIHDKTAKKLEKEFGAEVRK